ncbi:hypothetical protein PR048_003076 [Dryococelus australis]|uniref:Uncharacterized protein n=1 Tax=Dryococelus australis TaxID=614101 RepID=A0ABQ9IN12_9NEOP|nr:hypothetical protein PR048_003076 [Dryococelus australis]
MQGRGKRKIPAKTRQPAASSSTIPTSENAGVVRLGIGPLAEFRVIAGEQPEKATRRPAKGQSATTGIKQWSVRLAGWTIGLYA